MDLEYFLKDRTKFILYYFKTATIGFLEIISAIENKKEPYIPRYSEDGEPPFLDEWLEAKTGINFVGYAALSMLSSSLKLYLEEWTVRVERPEEKFNRKHKKGWFHAYRKILTDVGIALENCPADLALIEQVVLARNMSQHPRHITQMEVQHSPEDLKRYPGSIFISEYEAKFLDEDGLFSSFMAPQVTVDETKLREVISHVEILCTWLESQYWNMRNS